MSRRLKIPPYPVRQQIVSLHRAGFTERDIAERIGLDWVTVRLLLHRFGEYPAEKTRVVRHDSMATLVIRYMLEQLRPMTAAAIASGMGCDDRFLLLRVSLSYLSKCARVRALPVRRPRLHNYWFPTSAQMSLAEAHEMLLKGVEFGVVHQCVSAEDQPALKAWYVKHPKLPNLIARKASTGEGNLCGKCGGLMVRTGTCETCQSCGESSGGCG